MRKKKISSSLRKHLRRQKALIRKSTADKDGQQRLVKELYQNLGLIGKNRSKKTNENK